MNQRYLGVISGKGGVGKTTTVANLGAELAEFGIKTLVIDSNLMTSNLGIHLNLLYPPVTLTDCLKGEIPIRKIIYSHPSGLSIIPSSIAMGEVLDDTLLKKVTDGIKGQFECILFDSAPGLGRETSAVIKAANELVVITTPDLPSMSDTAKTVKIARDLGMPVTGVIVNRIKGKKYELTVPEIEKMCGCSVLAEIPEDEKVPESIAFKTPVVLYAPNSPASKAFKVLAANLSGMKEMGFERTVRTPQKAGILRRLWNFLFRKY